MKYGKLFAFLGAMLLWAGCSAEALGELIFDATETPEVTETPETPGTPETPETPGTPETPETPEVPGTPEPSASWKLVGKTNGLDSSASYTKVAFNNGVPYIAYKDESSKKAVVRHLLGDTWQILGSEVSAGAVKQHSLSIAFEGTNSHIPSALHVAYVDENNGDKPTVKKYNGTSWVAVGSTVSDSASEYTRLAFYKGVPYVAYQDKANNSRVTVKKYNGTSWEAVGGSVAEWSSPTGIAFNDSGEAHVVYIDVNNGQKAIVKKFNGTSWVAVGGAVSDTGVGLSTRIVFNDNAPYVAYDSGKITVKKFNGASWETVGSANFSGRSFGIDFAFNGSVPYVIYQDEDSSEKISVMKYNGSTWEHVGIRGFSAGQAWYPSITFYSGVPYVVYGDSANRRVTVMKFSAQ